MIQVMTKQEEIREGMHREILLWSNEDTRVGGRNTLELTKRILSHLHSQGVVIKGDTLGGSHPHLANYYTVEPLVE